MKKVKESILIFLIALVMTIFFLFSLKFALKSLTLEIYIQSVQPIIGSLFLTISTFFLAYFILKREFLKSILLALLPQLLYDAINYTIEAWLYGYSLWMEKKILTPELFTQRNLNLSLCDLKIVLSFIGIILWCLAWLKLKEK